jgi:hypothetical protein
MAIQGTDTATIHTAAILATIDRIRTVTTLGDHTTTDTAITVITGIITTTTAINVV